MTKLLRTQPIPSLKPRCNRVKTPFLLSPLILKIKRESAYTGALRSSVPPVAIVTSFPIQTGPGLNLPGLFPLDRVIGATRDIDRARTRATRNIEGTIILAALIHVFIYLCIIGFVAWVLWWAISQIPMPQPIAIAVRVIGALILVLIVLEVILPLAGVSGSCLRLTC